MSNLVCKNCKSIAVEYEDYCGGTSYFRCKTCGQRGDKDKFTQLTVFDYITQSVEKLAEEFVYHIYLTDCLQRKRSYWRSTFFPCNNFSTKEKAIAATIEELKKEYKKDE
jgi:hypothetical protein